MSSVEINGDTFFGIFDTINYERRRIMSRYISPYTDFGFKRLFGSEANIDLLLDFLNADGPQGKNQNRRTTSPDSKNFCKAEPPKNKVPMSANTLLLPELPDLTLFYPF